MVGVGLAFANPCALGGLAAAGLRGVNALQAVGHVANAGEQLAAGNLGAAAEELLGAAGGLGQLGRACFSGGMLVLTLERGGGAVG